MSSGTKPRREDQGSGFAAFCLHELRQGRVLAALAVIMAAGLAVRLAYMAQPMRIDESWTFMVFVRNGLGAVLSDYSSTNNHILNSLLILLSTGMFGDSPPAIRLPALFFGLLTMPLAFLVAAKAYNRSAGLLAAALVAGSSIMIEYSSNGRGYTAIDVAFLMLLLLGLYLRQHDSRAAWIGFAVCAALGCHAIPTMLFPLGGAVLWLGCTALLEPVPGGGRRFLSRLASSCLLGAALVLLLYAPVLLFSPTLGLDTVNPDVLPKSLGYFLRNTATVLGSVFHGWFRDCPLLVTVVLVGFLAAGLLFHKRIAGPRLPMLLAVAAWTGALLLAQRVVPYQRVLLFLLPLVLITAAGPAGHLLERFGPKRARGLLAPLLACILAVGLGLNVLSRDSIEDSTQTGVMRDGQAVAVRLAEVAEPGQAVAARTGKWIVAYYLHLLGRGEVLPSPATAPPAWVVCNSTEDYLETWPQVLVHAYPDLDPAAFTAELDREFVTARIYRLKHR